MSDSTKVEEPVAVAAADRPAAEETSAAPAKDTKADAPAEEEAAAGSKRAAEDEPEQDKDTKK
jgi:hypothetical protein